MSAEWTIFAVWLAGAIGMLGWAISTRWNKRHDFLRRNGMPVTTAAWFSVVLVACAAWPLIPPLRWIVDRMDA